MGKRIIGPHEDLTRRIIAAALAVHNRLGPGHKEEVYQHGMEVQSLHDGLAFAAQKMFEVFDNGVLVGYYIPDFVYEEEVITEIKAFAALPQRYLGQVITYLNHTGLKVGLLINFGARRLQVRRVFPSRQAAKYPVQYTWLFIPDWLRVERAAHPPTPSAFTPSVTRTASGLSVVSAAPGASGSVASTPSINSPTPSPSTAPSAPPSAPRPSTAPSAPPSSVASVAVSVSCIPRLLASLPRYGIIADVRIGTHWTVVVAETPAGRRAGLAATLIVHDLEHGRPAVRDAGRLIGRDARTLAELALSDSLTERSLGFAAINALLEVDEARCVDLNAEEAIIARGRGRRVAIVGHFPFVPKVREVAEKCWVLELNPGPDDLPAHMAPKIIPQADVVAITGMTLVNGTFDGLIALCRPDAYVLVLGPSTPLSPLLFDYGVDAISGTVVTDIPAVLTAVSQGATFRQITGRRLFTMTREISNSQQEAGR